MKKPFVIISLLGLLFLLASCDERDGVIPTIEMTVENNQLYSDGAGCDLDRTDITFILEGSHDFIAEVKILMEYDDSKGLFIGSSSSLFVITDESGMAEGRFLIDGSFLGEAVLTARVERFPSVTESKTIYAYDLPVIVNFYPESETLMPNQSTAVYVVLADQSGNVAHQDINFTTDLGSLENTTVRTDQNGMAENVFFSDLEAGTAEITASLVICPDVSQTLNVIIVE